MIHTMLMFDGDGFSIGGNHLNHGARKNINMVYFIMDNFVYGLTKKQTSPTSPIGYKSKTDPTGAIDHPEALAWFARWAADNRTSA